MNKALVDALNTALANSFEFYARAHGMHWNVEGMFFPLYHSFFGDIYTEVYGAIDTFAEEIRAVGGYVKYGTKSFNDENVLPQSDQLVGSKVKEMLNELDISNEIVLKSINTCFDLAEKEGNQGLMDFLASRLDAHKKHAWMIKSCLS